MPEMISMIAGGKTVPICGADGGEALMTTVLVSMLLDPDNKLTMPHPTTGEPVSTPLTDDTLAGFLTRCVGGRAAAEAYMSLRRCRPDRADYLRHLLHRLPTLRAVAAEFEEALTGEEAVLLLLSLDSATGAKMEAALTGRTAREVRRPAEVGVSRPASGDLRLHAVGRPLAAALLRAHLPASALIGGEPIEPRVFDVLVSPVIPGCCRWVGVSPGLLLVQDIEGAPADLLRDAVAVVERGRAVAIPFTEP